MSRDDDFAFVREIRKNEGLEMVDDFVVCGVSVGACVNNGSIRGGEEQPESDIAGENKRDTRQCHWQLRNTSIRW